MLKYEIFFIITLHFFKNLSSILSKKVGDFYKIWIESLIKYGLKNPKIYKESKEGIEIMCQAMEDMRNQTLKEGMINVAKKMLEDGTIMLEKIVGWESKNRFST